MKRIIKFILLYSYVYFSFFLMCFVGGMDSKRYLLFQIFDMAKKLILILMIFFAPVFFYATGAWLLCVVYRINGWDTGRKKKK